MKRILSLVLIIAMLFAFAGCQQETEAVVEQAQTVNEETESPITEVPETPVKIATLAGPTGMGLIELIKDDSTYSVEILTQPDQISPKIINGEVDIATIPSNLAAVLYNKMGGGFKLLAVNTTGVLYLLSSDSDIASFDSIDDQKVVLTGQGASPEYVFNKIVSEKGLNVEVEYLPAHADLSNAMAAGDITVGVLPEPFVSITLAQNPDLKIAANFNDEWASLFGEGVDIPMGVTIVSDSFIEENPEALEAFVADYQASVDYVNSDIDAAAQDIENVGLLAKAAIAKQAIPRCGISFIMGESCETMLGAFFGVLFESNPSSVGGEIPSEGFYYTK